MCHRSAALQLVIFFIFPSMKLHIILPVFCSTSFTYTVMFMSFCKCCLSIYHKNLFGRNQKLNLSLERGQIDSIYRINYTDPWVEGDDKRTSRSIMVQNSRAPGTLVHGNQPDNSSLTIGRVTAGIEYSRPFRPKWNGTAGIIFQRVDVRDDKRNPVIRNFYSSPLTASGNTHDDMLLAKLETVYTGSGDSGSSMLAFNMDQGIPVLPEWLLFNRLNARALKGFVVGPFRLRLSLSGGHVAGNFPPHEALGDMKMAQLAQVGHTRLAAEKFHFPLRGRRKGLYLLIMGQTLVPVPVCLKAKLSDRSLEREEEERSLEREEEERSLEREKEERNNP
ncbi:unnamed protein product [Cuscuta europaea]|uniref:Bacterial surface antigen (D15) domain-containing protein n=1 Tax=Cuscuta europaea TaxID=41803 RepID=A0A9P0ZS83_CUSEU|nr:unnamed protein product [Cuscuta europaea]